MGRNPPDCCLLSLLVPVLERAAMLACRLEAAFKRILLSLTSAPEVDVIVGCLLTDLSKALLALVANSTPDFLEIDTEPDFSKTAVDISVVPINPISLFFFS